jgi:hypothetical protein
MSAVSACTSASARSRPPFAVRRQAHQLLLQRRERARVHDALLFVERGHRHGARVLGLCGVHEAHRAGRVGHRQHRAHHGAALVPFRDDLGGVPRARRRHDRRGPLHRRCAAHRRVRQQVAARPAPARHDNPARGAIDAGRRIDRHHDARATLGRRAPRRHEILVPEERAFAVE